MFRRWPIVCIILLGLCSLLANAKNKKKPTLPDDILRAHTIFVVIEPDAGEPVTDPMSNRNAAEDVEKAITRWGRFELVPGAQTADLIIAVRKGHSSGPVIQNSPVDDRPVVIQSGGGDTRVGGHQGRQPSLSDPGLGPTDRGTQIGNEVGSSEDSFAVYMGGVEYPLDSAPLWRYMAKDGLKAPRVEAVEQFRKAINDSEQQRQHKP